ncbi:MAG TPA: hydroxyacid dehydrogenase [Candidatus Scatavimonas merdigallinarum]|uniref:Hydroxyacid dehydrogenase n=1 Tax=Candidatus Scatavimonas merdigallinarum TaxID=2840914 RepID=A0A9D1CVW2_9FIRM|nr:hydroxyacid dehydrogenase [Candidatus Scatavimonas merdigallinarum]
MNILLTGAFPYDAAQIRKIEKLGCTVEFVQEERKTLSLDCALFDAVVCNSLFLYNDIAAFKRLQYIQLTSAGLERAPLAYIREHGITLQNARGVYSVPMAEWIVLKILEIYKDSKGFYKRQKEKRWEKNRNLLELNGKTACIVGAGSVGQEAARRLQAFGVVVKAVDVCDVHSPFIDHVFPMQELDTALAQSDIAVLTLPLTPDTKHLFDRARFAKMKDAAVLVNVARGAVIKEEDLITALANGKLLGAALDVFEDEPLTQNSPLWDMDHVVITPHNSFVSDKVNARLFALIYNNLLQYISR